MSDFSDLVALAFRDTINREVLAIVFHDYDEKAFGNAVVILAGGNVRMRIVRDRGDVFADVASASFPEDWTPLERALMAIGTPDIRPEGLLTPKIAAELVEKHFSALDIAFGDGRIHDTRIRLREIQRFKHAEAMRRLKGNIKG